jgi:polyisoprenoid-binding protein YceI
MTYRIFFLTLSLFSYTSLSAQSVFFTRTGNIQFFSQTPLEDIKATNKKVYSSLNTETGSLQFLVQINQFEFKYSAMRDHFNEEEYMDSKKYPVAEFKGKITNLSSMDLTKNDMYSAVVEGQLTMHGVTQPVRAAASLTVNNSQIIGVAKFYVRLEDYTIKVPKIVFKKIAEVVEVTVNATYLPFKN